MYANTIYMVLNSRIQIMGGRDIYASSADMNHMIITTTSSIIQDTNLRSPQCSLGTDRRQGRAPVVAVTEEMLNGGCEMGGMNVSHCGSRTLLELISPPRINYRTRAWDMRRNCELTLCTGGAAGADVFISSFCNNYLFKMLTVSY